jgi:acyl-CoA synthetase (AMP-forming)/AMP-acid ligase II
VPCAVVHLADPAAASEADLLAFLAEHLAAFKVPHRLWFSADPLPRLGTEKIDKLALRKRYGELVAG